MKKIRLLVCGAFLGILFSGMNVLGKHTMLEFQEGIVGLMKDFLLCLPLASLLSALALWAWEFIIKFLFQFKLEKVCRRVMENRRIFWLMWVLIFLAWLPAFLASYPGVYVIDNVFQLQWFMEGRISAHHPIFHTYFLGTCIKIGRKFLGSYETGMCIYSIIQMLLLSLIFSYVINSLKDKVPDTMRLLFVLLYALIPYHAVSSFTATKDILYAGLFLLLVLKTYEIVVKPDMFFSSYRRMLKYLLLVFLNCCFRNTGIYIFICMIPVFLFLFRNYWKKIVILLAAAVSLWGIYTEPVYAVLGIQKGSSAEILSLPMQQISRALLYESSCITDEEKHEIEQYIPDYALYAPRVADPVKDTFHAEKFEKSPLSFIKLWVQTGLKCPRSYVQAFLELNAGFWWPQMEFPDPGTYLAFIPYRNADAQQVGNLSGDTIYINRHSYFPGLEKFYEQYTEDGTFMEAPVLRWLYSPGAAWWMVCFSLIFCIYKKRYRMLVPLSLFIALWLSLMVSPVVVFRYVYPMMVGLPLLPVFMGNAEEARLEEERKNE